ncbi:MAG: hypothetical protein QM765_34240 [Myxococcales bacterium]
MHRGLGCLLAVAMISTGCGTATPSTDAGNLPDSGLAGLDAAAAASPDTGLAAGPDAGSTGGTSVIPCEPYPDTDTVKCPGVSAPASLTVLEALRLFETSAKSEFPEAYWQGGATIIHVKRDGKLSATSSVSSVAFCANNAPTKSDGMRYFVLSGNDCRVERMCGTGTCSGKTTIPTIDSPQAILAAFPNDPDDAEYSFGYMGFMGNYWSIGHQVPGQPAGNAVKVDAATGAVIP